MAEFTPIETQEAFDAAIKDRIERAKKSAAADAAKQYEGWIKPEDAQKSADQIAALTKQVAELTAKNQAAELSALRTRIAHETGLPFELADRLHGEDEKALRADAEALGKLTAAKPAPSPAYSPETPVTSAADAAFRALASELNS
jgi:hypothetical protein